MDALPFKALELQIKSIHSVKQRLEGTGYDPHKIYDPNTYDTYNSEFFFAKCGLILESADTYYVSPEICSLLSGAMGTMPFLTEGELPLPSVNGFIYFGTQLDLSIGFSVRGILWSQEVERAEGLVIMCFDPKGIFLAADYWESNRALNDIEVEESYEFRDNDMQAAYLHHRSWLQAVVVFASQEIAALVPGEVPRHLRRRIASAPQRLPSKFNIVQLRRRAAPPKQQDRGGEHKATEWSHRWISRAHWRNQFYPTKFGEPTHRPKLIPSCVKGPDSKPLKPKAIDLFAVVR